jgi:hypothetical protein
MNTEMQLLDIFHLANGLTAFGGKLKDEVRIVTPNNPYIATLIVDGNIYQENIQITGEGMRGHPDAGRTISTKDRVDLDREFVKHHDCRLILTKQIH